MHASYLSSISLRPDTIESPDEAHFFRCPGKLLGILEPLLRISAMGSGIVQEKRLDLEDHGMQHNKFLNAHRQGSRLREW